MIDAEQAMQRLDALDPDAFGVPFARELLDELSGELSIAAAKLQDPERPLASALIVSQETLRETDLPARIADAVYGDAERVIHVADCIAGKSLTSFGITGYPRGVEPETGPVLAKLVEKAVGGAVVVFDDLQAYEPVAIDLLAD